MTDHPLTDEVIHREFLPKFCYRENDLRDAADWQLKQVLNWCSKYIHTKSVDALREAMRPANTLEDN